MPPESPSRRGRVDEQKQTVDGTLDFKQVARGANKQADDSYGRSATRMPPAFHPFQPPASSRSQQIFRESPLIPATMSQTRLRAMATPPTPIEMCVDQVLSSVDPETQVQKFEQLCDLVGNSDDEPAEGRCVNLDEAFDGKARDRIDTAIGAYIEAHREREGHSERAKDNLMRLHSLRRTCWKLRPWHVVRDFNKSVLLSSRFLRDLRALSQELVDTQKRPPTWPQVRRAIAAASARRRAESPTSAIWQPCDIDQARTALLAQGFKAEVTSAQPARQSHVPLHPVHAEGISAHHDVVAQSSSNGSSSTLEEREDAMQEVSRERPRSASEWPETARPPKRRRSGSSDRDCDVGSVKKVRRTPCSSHGDDGDVSHDDQVDFDGDLSADSLTRESCHGRRRSPLVHASRDCLSPPPLAEQWEDEDDIDDSGIGMSPNDIKPVEHDVEDPLRQESGSPHSVDANSSQEQTAGTGADHVKNASEVLLHATGDAAPPHSGSLSVNKSEAVTLPTCEPVGVPDKPAEQAPPPPTPDAASTALLSRPPVQSSSPVRDDDRAGDKVAQQTASQQATQHVSLDPPQQRSELATPPPVAQTTGKLAPQSEHFLLDLCPKHATSFERLLPGKMIGNDVVDILCRLLVFPTYHVVDSSQATEEGLSFENSVYRPLKHTASDDLPPAVLPVPVGGNHFAIAYIDPNLRRCDIMDPWKDHSFHEQTAKQVLSFVRQKLRVDNADSWTTRHIKDAPVQNDSHSCGIRAVFDALVRTSGGQTQPDMDESIARYVFSAGTASLYQQTPSKFPSLLSSPPMPPTLEPQGPFMGMAELMRLNSRNTALVTTWGAQLDTYSQRLTLQRSTVNRIELAVRCLIEQYPDAGQARAYADVWSRHQNFAAVHSSSKASTLRVMSGETPGSADMELLESTMLASKAFSRLSRDEQILVQQQKDGTLMVKCIDDRQARRRALHSMLDACKTLSENVLLLEGKLGEWA